MIDANQIPEVEPNELLARFVVQSSHYRSDNTVTPALFTPYRYVELSVNRHRDATIDETWQIGRNVSQQLGKSLHGRCDIVVLRCCIEPLAVFASPIIPGNPNHADVRGFPATKEDQKALALKLAANASLRIEPPTDMAG